MSVFFRRLGIILLVLAVGGGVAALFYWNGHSASLHVGSGAPVELPMAVHMLGALAVGAGLVLLAGLVRSSARAASRWRERRQARRQMQLERTRGEGRERLWAGDFASAEKVLARAAQKEPTDLETALSLGRSHEERGDYDTARRILEAARAHHGPDTRILSRLGRIALARGSAGEAVGPLREAVEARPDSPRLLAELMTALAAEGRFTEAADVAKRRFTAERESTRRETAREEWLGLRVRAAAADADIAKGTTALHRLVREEPTFLPAVVELAERVRSQGDARSSDKILRVAARQRPAGVLLERLVALHSGDLPRALGPLRDACAGNQLVGPRLLLARTLVAADQPEAAEAQLADLAREEPGVSRRGADPGPERDLITGELALSRGNDREAAKLLLRAATANRAPFTYTCRRCGRTTRTWVEHCRCGSYGTYDWSVDLPEEVGVKRA